MAKKAWVRLNGRGSEQDRRKVCTYLSIEFFCAHPRWTVQSQDIPTNVWMRWDPRTNTTDYVIVSAKGQDVCFTIKRMLSQLYAPSAAPSSMQLHDPFVIHALIADELYVEAEKVARHLRYGLYSALDKVANFTHPPSHLSTARDDEYFDDDPRALTLELHEISQDLDLMLANSDMALGLNAMMQTVHSRFEAVATADNVVRDAAVKMADFLRYNAACLEHQKRWLRSCASRKETAMSLVRLFSTSVTRPVLTSSSGLPSHRPARHQNDCLYCSPG